MSTAVAELEERTPATWKLAQPTRHIDALRPLPDNPREDIREDDPKIIEMAHSIIKTAKRSPTGCGVIEPLVINPDGFLYAGHRRRVASRVAYKITGDESFLFVPVTINHTPIESALELVLQENMQRALLSLTEEARAMKAIMDRRGFNVADLAREIAVPASEISPRLAILKCEPEVQALFATDQISLSAAVWLAQCDLAEQQINYAGMLARRQITLTKLKEEMREASYKERNKKPAKPKTETAAGKSDEASVAGTRAPVAKATVSNTSKGVVTLPTREDAMASLTKSMGRGKRSISLFNFKQVVESICCACGMVGKEDICRSCPFARIILGVAGRAD